MIVRCGLCDNELGTRPGQCASSEHAAFLKANPRKAETFWESLREAALPLAGVLLAVVVVVWVFYAHSQGYLDGGSVDNDC